MEYLKQQQGLCLFNDISTNHDTAIFELIDTSFNIKSHKTYRYTAYPKGTLIKYTDLGTR